MIRPGKREQSTCPHCQKVFIYLVSQKTEYCSRACQKAAGTARRTRICEQCGRPFEKIPGTAGRFCSRPCAGLAIRVGPDRICPQCEKAFHAKPIRETKFCSSACWQKYRSEQYRDIGHPLFAKRIRRPITLPAPIFRSCRICADEFRIKPSQEMTRHCCSRACHAEWQRREKTGENSANWRGGWKKSYYGPSWQKAKRAARERDSQCAECGKTAVENGKALCVHHIQPFRLFGVARHLEANALTNLECLCPSCHLKKEWRENSHSWPKRLKKHG